MLCQILVEIGSGPGKMSKMLKMYRQSGGQTDEHWTKSD